MSFRLVSKSMTLNDLERRNGVILRCFSEFGYLPGALCKSSRSLSHLLMSSCDVRAHRRGIFLLETFNVTLDCVCSRLMGTLVDSMTNQKSLYANRESHYLHFSSVVESKILGLLVLVSLVEYMKFKFGFRIL